MKGERDKKEHVKDSGVGNKKKKKRWRGVWREQRREVSGGRR